MLSRGMNSPAFRIGGPLRGRVRRPVHGSAGSALVRWRRCERAMGGPRPWGDGGWNMRRSFVRRRDCRSTPFPDPREIGDGEARTATP